MFAMAAALGCDLFDSAAYALYARDDRYLTVQGTELLSELTYFPCHCPVCTDHTPAELDAMDADQREELLARHNLHVTYGEIRTVKQAIRSGNLMELVDSRARGHPAMLDGYRALLDHAEQLERTDPVSKDAFFYTSSESALRPEVRRHQDRLERLPVEGDEVLLTEGSSSARYDETWGVLPPFGPYPRELADTYPLTAEVPDRTDAAAELALERALQRFDGNHVGPHVGQRLHDIHRVGRRFRGGAGPCRKRDEQAGGCQRHGFHDPYHLDLSVKSVLTG
jgi:7-cyano-7-deazaguanine tRNA-ribosyltransferase